MFHDLFAEDVKFNGFTGEVIKDSSRHSTHPDSVIRTAHGQDGFYVEDHDQHLKLENGF